MREALCAPLRRAGYGYVETPVFEDTALFKRGVGESTDIVSKEMYTFTTAAALAHAAARRHRRRRCAPCWSTAWTAARCR